MQHLTEEDIAISAEALQRGEYNSLPIEVREHLSQCDQCAEEVLMVADIADDIDFSLTDKIKSPEKDKTQRIIAWSVSVAAAIALVLLVFNINKNDGRDNMTTDAFITQGEEDTITENQSGDESLMADKKEKDRKDQDNKNDFPAAKTPDQEKIPAASSLPPSEETAADTLKFMAMMEKNEDLEKLVERCEGNMRNQEGVVVESPFNILAEGDSVTIKWKNPDRKRLIIEIFNNSGLRIFETETTEESYTLSELEKGLYYWKLISSDYDLLFCGRIVLD